MRPIALSIPLAAALLGALLVPPPAHACPPGFYPTGGDRAGWHACAPMGPMEEAPPDQQDGRADDNGLPPIHFSPRQWQEWAEGARRAEAWRESERMKDPAYPRLKKGYWDFAASRKGDARHICMASFLSARGGVLLMDWTGAQPGSFLAFYGGAIPRAAAMTQTTVSLTQSGERQTVRAFHAPLPWAQDIGMILFAVPSTQALLASIEDVQDFEVESGGQSVARGAWHSGEQARRWLQDCVSRRQSAD